MTLATKTKTKQPPAPLRLDGKPAPRPRGRHAKGRPKAERIPNAITPLPARLGYRVGEFAALLGVSRPTVWRGIRAGTIKVAMINKVKIIPHSFAVESGLLKD